MVIHLYGNIQTEYDTETYHNHSKLREKTTTNIDLVNTLTKDRTNFELGRVSLMGEIIICLVPQLMAFNLDLISLIRTPNFLILIMKEIIICLVSYEFNDRAPNPIIHH